MWKKFSFFALIGGILIVSGCQKVSNQPNKNDDAHSSTQNTQEATAEFSLSLPDSAIEWTLPQAIPSLQLFRNSTNSDGIITFLDNQTKYYRIGTIHTGKYSGDEMVMAITEPNAPYYFPPVLRFVRDQDQLIFLKKYSDEIDISEFINTNISFENSDELDALLESRLGAPETIAIPSEILNNTSGEYHLKLTQRTSVFFSPKNLQPVFTLADGRKIFMEKNGKNNWSEDDHRLFQLHGFYLPLADRTVALYELEIPFMTDFTPQITWKDGAKNADSYGLWEGEGCRPTSGLFPKVIDGQIEFLSPLPGDHSVVHLALTKDDLTVVGKTNTAESIFGLKDDEHPFYQEYYEKIYVPTFKNINDGAIVSYDDFKHQKPFLFWTDPFGRMNLFMSGNFHIGLVCAGKPVIYLYPETPQKIFVNVHSSRKQFMSIPEGNNGWKVMADPKGHIIDTASGQEFPYLFWEDAITYARPTKGFLIAAADVDSFLDQKLKTIGLRDQEISDFKAFWSPKMKKYPYSFVSFLQTDELNTIVPLEISPQPDSLIRVFMHFEGLEQPIPAEPQVLKPEKRFGFTVVEWGGRL